MPILNREVVGMFFKDTSNRVRLHRLVVLQEETGRSGPPVYLIRQEWDVDYSRRFGYLFHNSGSGGDEYIEVSGIYHVTVKAITNKLLGEPVGELVSPVIVEKDPTWVDSRDDAPFDNKPRTLEVRKRNRTRRLFTLPKHIDIQPGQDLLDWLQENGIESESVYCSTCHDYFPGSNDFDLCEHIWWCDKTGTYSTPYDRCDCKDREDCGDCGDN